MFVFPNVFCVCKPFSTIYIFLLFTPLLLGPFRSVKEVFYCMSEFSSSDGDYEISDIDVGESECGPSDTDSKTVDTSK